MTMPSGWRFPSGCLCKLHPPLAEITILGPWKVRCWESRGLHPHLLYGKIGPLAGEYRPDLLLQDLTYLDQNGATLQEVLPLLPRADGSRFFWLAFKSTHLPIRLILGHQVIPVLEHKQPALHCRNCYLFGHGALACRRKVRCANCSGFHPFITSDGIKCPNPPFCFFCGVNRLRSKVCPALDHAAEVLQHCQLHQLSTQDTNAKLRTILPPPAPQPTPKVNTFIFPQQCCTSNPTAPPGISLNNSFAILSGISQDLNQPPPHTSSDGDFCPELTTPLLRRQRRSGGDTPARHHVLHSGRLPPADILVHHPAPPAPSPSPEAIQLASPLPTSYADKTKAHRPPQPRPASHGHQPLPSVGTDWFSLFPSLLGLLPVSKRYSFHPYH